MSNFNTEITAGSLFSGIGVADLAFGNAGITVKFQCEIDPKAISVLTHHWPDVERYTDVKEIGTCQSENPVESGDVSGGSVDHPGSDSFLPPEPRGEQRRRGGTASSPRCKCGNCGRYHLQAVDILVGGFPCQDLSVAGKREGLAGKRSGLWYEFARIIDQLEPAWVVIENVPGLLSSESGLDFAIIISWLAKRGYGVSWRVLDSQYYGVAQRRRRVFIIGSFGNGRSAEILFESQSLRWNPPSRRKKGQSPSPDAGKIAEGDRGEGNRTFQNTRQGNWNDNETGTAIRASTGAGAYETNLVAESDLTPGGYCEWDQ